MSYGPYEERAEIYMLQLLQKVKDFQFYTENGVKGHVFVNKLIIKIIDFFDNSYNFFSEFVDLRIVCLVRTNSFLGNFPHKRKCGMYDLINPFFSEK